VKVWTKLANLLYRAVTTQTDLFANLLSSILKHIKYSTKALMISQLILYLDTGDIRKIKIKMHSNYINDSLINKIIPIRAINALR
jgi:hypothetical protein